MRELLNLPKDLRLLFVVARGDDNGELVEKEEKRSFTSGTAVSFLGRYCQQIAPGSTVSVRVETPSFTRTYQTQLQIEKAVVDFFAEQKLSPTVIQQGAFKRYSAGAISILCGDFFALSTDDLAAVDAFYDRASLIALPDELRRLYAEHLSKYLPNTCQGLLLTLDYPQAEMNGPPFAVSPEQVEQLLGDTFILECLEERDALGQEWRFKDAGVTRLFEYVYCVKHRDFIDPLSC